MRKWLMIAALLLLLVVWGWKPLVGTWVRWQVEGYCREQLGATFQCEAVVVDSSCVMIEQLSCATVAGEELLAADTLVLDYGIDLWQRHLDVAAVIHGLQLKAELPVASMQLPREGAFFSMAFSLVVEDGRVMVGDEEFFTQLAIESGEGISVRGRCAFGGRDYEHNALAFALIEKENHHCGVEVTFSDVDCKRMTLLGHAFDMVLRDCSVVAGRLHGSIAIRQEQGHSSLLCGALQLAGFELVGSGVHLAIPGLTIEMGEEERRLELLGEACLLLAVGDSMTPLRVNVLEGLIADDYSKAEALFIGSYTQGSEVTTWQLIAAGSANQSHQLEMALTLEQAEGVTQLEGWLQHLGDEWYRIQVAADALTHRHLSLLQRCGPEWFKQGELDNGRLSLAVTAMLKGGVPHEIEVTQLVMTEMSGLFCNLEGRKISAEGMLSIDLAAAYPMETLVSEIAVTDGNVAFLDGEIALWEMEHIATTLRVKQGVIQNSELRGHLLGMEGTLLFGAGPRLMTVELKGTIEQLTPLLPDVLRRGVEQGLNGDHVVVKGLVSQRDQGLEIEGHLQVGRRETVAFGFEVQKAPIAKLSQQQQLIMELVGATAPPQAALAVQSWRSWLERESGELVLRNGWFQAYNIPLDKYVTPFVFPEEEPASLTFEGRGDVMGHFDHTAFSVSYNVHQLEIESSSFLINIDRIVHLGAPHKQQAAFHYVDFKSGDSFGVVPVTGGRYLEKNSGLLFEQVNAQVLFHGPQIYVVDVDTHCLGIHFFGTIDIDYSLPGFGAFDAAIQIDAMRGRVPQLQSLYSHFHVPSCFLTMPLDGVVHLKDQGARLLFNVRPDQSTAIETAFHAVIEEGSCCLPPLDVALEALHFEIDYGNNALSLSAIDGTLLIGPAERIDTYAFVGDTIHFSDCANSIGRFDLWVSDDKRDIMRMAGTTRIAPKEQIVIELDRSLTHFGELYLDEAELYLHNWTTLDYCKVRTAFALETCFGDLKRLGKSAIFFLPAPFSDRIDQLESGSGTFTLAIDYDQECCHYRLAGEQVALGGWSGDIFLFEGSVNKQYWAIDQLQLDRISFSSELERLSDRWKVGCLAFRWGELLLAGLDGEYRDDSVDLQLRLCEVDLAALSQVPDLISHSLHGRLNARGKIHINVGKVPSYDAIVSCSLHDWSINDVAFTDAEGISCHLVGGKSITFRQLKTGIQAVASPAILADLHLDHVSYDWVTGATACDGLRFSTSAEMLANAVDALHQLAPQQITTEVAAHLRTLKRTGKINAILHYRQAALGAHWNIAIDPGTYALFGQQHTIDNFTLESNPSGISLTTQYDYHQERVWLQMATATMNRGSLFLSSDHPDSDGERLCLNWEVTPDSGFTIQEVNGNIAGCHIALHRDLEPPAHFNRSHMVGVVEAALPRAFTLLDTSVAKSFYEQGCGGLWRFEGKWTMGIDCGLHFSGTAAASDVTFRGYQFESATGSAHYTPQYVEMRDWELVDPAGTIAWATMQMEKQSDEGWAFSLPHLAITSLRPWLLHPVGAAAPQSNKPLVITTMDIHDLHGWLADPTSYRGHGALLFTNSAKSAIKNTLFAIPAEIITRIGLNPAVLTPAEGGISYHIHDGKMFFTAFKDVYSEGKASKFYLPNSNKESSYVDFIGNVNVQLRMKQYNILFKLTEPFVVSIKGTLTKPTYTLQPPGKK